MRSSHALLLGALLCAAPALPAEPQDEVLDEVLVVGEQPGPGLWKVSKGDNVMWVLASNGQMSRQVTWRPQQVQARIAESQEVLYPPSLDIHPGIGILHALTLLPSLLKAGRNPDGKSMKELLPPDLYARWRVARDKYIAPKEVEDLEEWRPEVAITQLRGMAFARSGLFRGSVDRLVSETAKKHKVRMHRLPTLERVVKLENPRSMLKSARKLQQPDLACFTRALDTIEPDIERAKVRANAWSRGDIQKLRELNRDYRPNEADCLFALATGYTELGNADAARAKKILADMRWHEEQGRVQAQRDWLAAAQQALEKNRSTFAVLPVEDVLRDDGHLEKLRALGYTVEEPL